jgi:hypothetical protein
MNFVKQPPMRTRFLMQRPIHRPTWEPSGGTITADQPVIHTRAFGSHIVSIGASFVTTTSVVHTRGFGTPRISLGITTVSVVHTRAFGVPKLDLYIYPGGQSSGPHTAATVSQSNQGANWADWDTVVPSVYSSDNGVVGTVVVPPSGANASEDLRLTNLGVGLSKGPQGYEVDIVFRGLPAASQISVYLTKDAGVASFIGARVIPGNANLGRRHERIGNPCNNAFAAGGWGGTALTEAEVEHTNFGLVLIVQNGEATPITVSIDYVAVRVHGLGAVVHARRFTGGGTKLSVAAVTVSTTSVLHTRAFGTPNAQVPANIFTISVIHTRGFGVPALGPPVINPAVIQRRFGMLDDWLVKGFEKNQKERV